MDTVMKLPEHNDIPTLLQEIDSIIDTRHIGEVEPEDDEISLIAEYQDRKKKGTLKLCQLPPPVMSV